jgi:cytoskeletal protein RodZ
LTTPSKQTWSIVLAVTVFTFTLLPENAAGQDHVVPLSELQQKLRSAAEQRTKNIADIERVLSYPAAAEALQKYNVNQEQMRRAVATLSDEEVARLAERARASEKDVQAGIIVGLLALIGLIVVILIVVAIVAQARPPSVPDSSAGYGRVKHAPSVPEAAAIHG